MSVCTHLLFLAPMAAEHSISFNQPACTALLCSSAVTEQLYLFELEPYIAAW